MSLDFVDKSGDPPTLEDVQRVKIAVIKSLFVMVPMMKIAPELTIELTTIKRCLEMLEAIMRHETASKKMRDA